uniref:Uncharacterized protein n=1 Tax=Anopheles minimus TaxID=112268 RepID=A0A182WPB2_9DIPT
MVTSEFYYGRRSGPYGNHIPFSQLKLLEVVELVLARTPSVLPYWGFML